MEQEEYPFQISSWLPGTGDQKSIFDRGRWSEDARCRTKERAAEVALCMSLRHPSGIQIAELTSDDRGSRFVAYKFFPESAKFLK